MSYLVELLLAAAEDARSRGDARTARARYLDILKNDPTNVVARRSLDELTTLMTAAPVSPLDDEPTMDPEDGLDDADILPNEGDDFDPTAATTTSMEAPPAAPPTALNTKPPTIAARAVVAAAKTPAPVRETPASADEIFGPSRLPQFLGVEPPRGHSRVLLGAVVVATAAAAFLVSVVPPH